MLCWLQIKNIPWGAGDDIKMDARTPSDLAAPP